MGIQVQNLYKGENGVTRSLLERQFTSFSFGGKDIEEFDLVCTISGDSLNSTAYSDFSDTTSTYTNIDGQIYWNSTFSPRTLNFTLSTDGMEERKLEEFKVWFRPGVIRELILSEHSNRYALARVSSAPTLDMLPFEKAISININGTNYSTSTTEYKGSIQLSLVLDEPFWYSKTAFFSTSDLQNKLNLKIVAEDRIPCVGVLSNNTLISNNKKYNGSNFVDNTGLDLTESSNIPLYYAGSATAKPQIEFTLKVRDSGTSYSFNFNGNKINVDPLGYDSIFITKTGHMSIQFKYGLPDILSSYNISIDFINGAKTDLDGNKLYKNIRDGVTNSVIRNYALSYVDYYLERNQITTVNLDTVITNLKNLVKNLDLLIQINSKTGEATLSYTLDSQLIEEKCGNMIKSKYINIEGIGINDSNWSCYTISSTQKIFGFKINFENTYL